jgi:putative flippase GtrA
LQGATSATIQLRGSDATACVSATLSNVTINDGTTFKAK